jgi:hypothetical protein
MAQTTILAPLLDVLEHAPACRLNRRKLPNRPPRAPINLILGDAWAEATGMLSLVTRLTLFLVAFLVLACLPAASAAYHIGESRSPLCTHNRVGVGYIWVGVGIIGVEVLTGNCTGGAPSGPDCDAVCAEVRVDP